MKEKNPCLQTCLDNTEKENLNPKKEVGGLKQRLVKQEDYSRRENLRFYNIPEGPEETTEAELCSDCKGCFSRAWSTIKHKVPCNSLHREEGTASDESTTSQDTVGQSRARLIIARLRSGTNTDTSTNIFHSRGRFRRA